MTDSSVINNWISSAGVDNKLSSISKKVLLGQRISAEDALLFFNLPDLTLIGLLANYIREKKHGNKTYFNSNFHIEPTNICVFDCKFCAYSRLINQENDDDVWTFTKEDILKEVKRLDDNISEVHIVGGVHPKMGLKYFTGLISDIEAIRPDIQIKAFTAVELDYMCRKAKVTYKDGLKQLMNAGQVCLPGGGAEIFDENIRAKICKDKCSSERWLEIHKTAHRIGMRSNATMLYGHIESYEHRVDHMDRLRKLQDETGGFQCFIPLKFRNANNQMSNIPEVSVIEDLKCYAISRIFLDNFDHIKAYWPMCGRDIAQIALSYGVDDIDGTIEDSTKIYSMAGAEEKRPSMNVADIKKLVKAAGRIPVERDTLYAEKSYLDI